METQKQVNCLLSQNITSKSYQAFANLDCIYGDVFPDQIEKSW